jgi:hypothetical protein
MLTLESTNQNNLAEELFQLESVRDELQDKITQAQFLRDEAIAKAKRTGEYSEAQWFIGLSKTIRDRTTDLHSTNRLIKAIKRQLNRSNPKASFFQEAAKSHLKFRSL